METTIPKEIVCPVCRSKTKHLYKKDVYDIAKCVKCKTIFVTNPPQDTTYLYNDSYFFGGDVSGGYGSYDEEKSAMRGTFEKCLTMISEHQNGGSLFDVGAATGYFLSVAREFGFTVSGVEVSGAAARVAQEKGIDVSAGTLDTVARLNKVHDVVTMFDVIEHVREPDRLLKDASAILKENGIIMGCTPDSRSVTARVMGRHWHLLFPPEHLVLLNAESVRSLLEESGFEAIWIGRITKRFSLPYILQTASRWLKIPFLGRLGVRIRGSFLSRIAIPLDLRDNLFFLARKKHEARYTDLA